MIKIRLAGIVIAVENRYDLLEWYCRGYTAGPGIKEDISISVSPEKLDEELEKTSGISRRRAELFCVYREIGYRVLPFDALLMHAVILDFEGTGIAFMAPSGTGKTTLTCNIRKVCKNRVRIINGDKPIIRVIGRKIYAFGTPWNGKEGYGCQSFVELKKLCFLYQDQENHIQRTESGEAMKRLMKQLLIPEKGEDLNAFFGILELLLQKTEAYCMGCLPDEDAARTAIRGMELPLS